MRYASVCSGIEAATVAWHPLGWEPVWFSQYDPENNYAKGLDFPSEVLKYHYPHVPNLGDMTKLSESKTYQDEQFELIVGGTPCQSFSIAGLRGGIRDERGNLALEFVRILVDKRPSWFLWENVPGVLTSGKEGSDEGDGEEDEEPDADPRDFACLLSAWTGRDIAPQEFSKGGVIEAETEQDYSVAWCIFDSQYFGVPQRRRRIFVVGHLGKDWRPPVAVLFEQDSLRRDFTPGGKKRKGTAEDAKNSAGFAGESVTTDGLPAYRMTAFGEYADDNTASTLKKRDYKDATDLVLIDRAAFNQGENALYDPKYEENPTTSPTLIKRGPHAVCPKLSAQSCNNEQPTANSIQGNMIGRSDNAGPQGSGISKELSFTLTKGDRHGVAHIIYDTTQVTSPQNGSNPQPGDPCHPLVKNGHVPLLIETTPSRIIIRRTTPVEHLRLQGFPDDYLCNVPGYSDSKAYAACGNSMTTWVMQHIGKRINLVHKVLKSIANRTSATK